MPLEVVLAWVAHLWIMSCADTPLCCARAVVLSPPLGGGCLGSLSGLLGPLSGFGALAFKLLGVLLRVWLDFYVCQCFLEFLPMIQLTFAS